MLLNARRNSFLLLFPKEFFDPIIKEKYKKQYLNSLMLPYDDVDDYMSSTIQSIQFPGWNMDVTPQQVRLLGAEQEFKSSKPVKDLVKREFQVTFQIADGFLNYFIFYDNAINYLNFKDGPTYLPIMKLGMINNEGYLVSHIDFKMVLLTGMTDIELNHAAVSQEFNSFTATFKYMDWKMHLDYGSETNTESL